jgi:hypothetical protein
VCAPEPGKTAADDYDVRSRFRGLHGFTLRHLQRIGCRHDCSSPAASRRKTSASRLVSSPQMEGENYERRDIVTVGLPKCGEASQPIVTAAIRPFLQMWAIGPRTLVRATQRRRRSARRQVIAGH